MRIDVTGIRAGCEIWLNGRQRYFCCGEVEAFRQDGSRVWLLLWESRCAACHEPIFEATTKRGLHSFSRRCQLHRAPGRPAYPKRRAG